MTLRSIQFVRSVKLLMVGKEQFTVRKLHGAINTWNIFPALLVKFERGPCLYGLYSLYGP